MDLADELAVADVLVNAEFLARFVKVVDNGGGGRDLALLGPGVPGEAESEQVAVGADAGVFEEGPRSAELLAGIEKGVGAAGETFLEAIGGVDAGLCRRVG